MLIDLKHIHPTQTNTAIEYLCKSAEESLTFEPHPTSPLHGTLEDAASEMVDRALRESHAALLNILVIGATVMRKSVVSSADDDECHNLEEQIRTAAPGSLDFKMYLKIIDCILRRYLPEPVLLNDAKKNAVRQYLAGKLKSQILDHEAKETVEKLPTSLKEAKHFGLFLSDVDRARIDVAQEAAARNVTDLSAAARSRMRKIIIESERRRLSDGTDSYAGPPLQQALADTFGELNRDWRRIAVTETANNAADGYLASLKPGQHVKWLSHPGACQYCTSQNGKVFEVVPSNTRKKNPETQVWVGKQAMNIGRSIAKRKRLEDGTLVDRLPEELVVPAIPVHPVCRCLWMPYVALTADQQRRLTASRIAA